MELKSLFFPKTYKNRPAAGGSAPLFVFVEYHRRGVCDMFEYTSLLNTSPKVDICIF